MVYTVVVSTGNCLERFHFSGGADYLFFNSVDTELKWRITEILADRLYQWSSDIGNDVLADLTEPDEKRANETATGDAWTNQN